MIDHTQRRWTMHGHALQSFYGAATVGERGQVVIPQMAREALGIKPGDKMLVLGGGFSNHGLIMIKAEAVSAFLAKMSEKFNNLEKMIQISSEQHDKENMDK